MAVTAFAAAPAGVCARRTSLASPATTSSRPVTALGVCAFTPFGCRAARFPAASAGASPAPLPLSPVADGTVSFPSDLDGSALRVGIVSARWRSDLTGPMVADVVRGLCERSVKEENIVQMEVPGCGELPVAARLMMASQKVDVVVAVGVLIDGSTDGYSFMCEAVSNGLMNVRIFASCSCVSGCWFAAGVCGWMSACACNFFLCHAVAVARVYEPWRLEGRARRWAT